MDISPNPHRGRPGALPALADIPDPSIAAASVRALLARCPRAAPTPLGEIAALRRPGLAGAVHVKDERARMGLGSFKALGAAYAVALDAARGDAAGAVYVAASAGNHGMSLAAGAAAFGARAVIYIAETVPESFARRLRETGAEVVRAGETYEASMQAAMDTAAREGWRLLSDSSWPGYLDPPFRVMEGYLALMAEAIEQMPEPPSHIFLQAGVGGLAAACAALAREHWGDGPRIIVVEPEAAPALAVSIADGAPASTEGPVSSMGRLDCKTPSLIALKGLARDADHFALISEEEAAAGADAAAEAGLPSTPSGAAGLSALIAAGPHAGALGLSDDARVLIILSEGPET